MGRMLFLSPQLTNSDKTLKEAERTDDKESQCVKLYVTWQWNLANEERKRDGISAVWDEEIEVLK